MRIVHISDTHSLHRNLRIPYCDVLVCTGDITGNKRSEIANLYDFREWCRELLAKMIVQHVLFVPGNHEMDVEGSIDFVRALFDGIHILIDESLTLDGVNFYGSPWTLEHREWAFMKPQSEMHNVWQRIPKHTNVLLTHGPPYGILDYHRSGRLGDQSLRYYVEKSTVLLHAFGHIHSAYGAQTLDGKLFINSALLKDSFEITDIANLHLPHVVDLVDGRATLVPIEKQFFQDGPS